MLVGCEVIVVGLILLIINVLDLLVGRIVVVKYELNIMIRIEMLIHVIRINLWGFE